MSLATTPRRRWFRFSLRTFFVLIVLLAILCAWVAREVTAARERYAVCLRIIESQQGVNRPGNGRDWQWWIRFRKSTWLEELFGEPEVASEFWYPRLVTPDELKKMKALFPNAKFDPWPDENPPKHLIAPVGGYPGDLPHR